MSEPELISAMEAHQRVSSGGALLVCAYQSDYKFQNVRLQGAIPLSSFEEELTSIDRAREIIFYCA